MRYISSLTSLFGFVIILVCILKMEHGPICPSIFFAFTGIAIMFLSRFIAVYFPQLSYINRHRKKEKVKAAQKAKMPDAIDP